MAGLNVTPDQIAQARAAGYSDPEIVSHLSEQAPEKFSTALKEGYTPTEILQHLAPEKSGVADNFRQGVAEGMQGIGSTLEQYTGKGPVGTYLQEKGKAIAPPNFVPSPLVDENGIHPSNALRSLARGTPAAAAALLAASAAPEALGVGGAIAAGTGVGTLMSAGDAAKARAVSRTGDPNAVPNAADKTIGGLTAVGSSAVQSAVLPRFLRPGVGASLIGNTGLRGVADVAKKALVSTGEQAAASGASNTISQAGNTVGTPGGLSVDPTQVANAAATGGVMGGALAGKRAIPEALDAAKFSGITPELKPAATQFANRMVNAADGRNLQGSLVFSGGAQRAGEDSFTKAKAAVHSELDDAVSGLTTPLPTDAQNILHAALKGDQPTPGDYAKLKGALANDPEGSNIINLVQQAHAADILGNTGYHYSGKFTGGGAGALGHALTGEHATKTALAALVGGEAGHLITFSPEMLGVSAGAIVAKRLLDNMTGAQAPAGRIVRNFADGQTPVRIPPTPPPPPGGGGAGPFGGSPQAGGPGTLPMIPPAIQAQMALRANLAKAAAANAPQPAAGPNPKQTIAQFMAGINAMKASGAIKNAMQGPQPAPAAPPPAPSFNGAPGTPAMIPPQVAAQMKLRAALAQAAANKQQPAPTAPAPVTRFTGAPGTPAMLPPAIQAQMALRSNLAKLAPAPQAPAPVIDPAAIPAKGPIDLPDNFAGALGKGPPISLAALRAATAPAAPKEPARGPIDLPTNFAGSLSGHGGPVMSLASMRAAVAPPVKAAPAPQAPPKITGVTKTNGHIGTKTETPQGEEYTVPRSPYAHLVPSAAAQQFLADAQAGGTTITSKQGFLNGTQRNISDIRARAAALAREVPGVNAKEIAAQFEGVSTQKDAIRHREWLKKQMPQAAAALDQLFSNEVIEGNKTKAGIWKRVGK